MRILTIADLHIGSIKDIVYFYNITTDIIDQELCFNKTDMIVIYGDYFHRLFKVNEEYVALAINIMSHIIRRCRSKKVKLRIIYGTESHEMNQYRLFNYHINSTSVDMKIIDTVTEEEINGLRLLYIPEEYVEDKHTHYQQFFNNQYDYIFGHGIIVEGMPMAVYDSSAKSNEKKVPHFKSKELSSISKVCVFGHYHCYTDMGDNCYYLGSLFRDSFGEEIPKGYGIIDNDVFTFIENKEAYVYKTYTYEEDAEIFKSSDVAVSEIKRIKDENPDIFNDKRIGKIRIVLKLPADVNPSFKETFRTLIFNDKQISALIKETLTEEIVGDETSTEYDYILDNSLDVFEKIHRFMNKEYDFDMGMILLKKYITEEFQLI